MFRMFSTSVSVSVRDVMVSSGAVTPPVTPIKHISQSQAVGEQCADGSREGKLQIP